MDLLNSKYSAHYYSGEDSDCVARFFHKERPESYAIYRADKLILVVHSFGTTCEENEDVDTDSLSVRLEAIIPYAHRASLLELCTTLNKEGFELSN